MLRIIYTFSFFVIFFFAQKACGHKDIADLSTIASEYDRKNYTKAASLSNHHPYRYLHRYLKYCELLDQNNNSSFETISHFLLASPGISEKNALIEKMERRITQSTSKNAIIKWFTHNKPLTPNGYIYYYKAALGKIKNQDACNKIIRNAWIFGNMSKEDSRNFYTKHKEILRTEDHVDKISGLLWQKKVGEAKALLHLVHEDYKKAFRAWISAIKGDVETERLFHEVRGSYKYISGLLYSYLKLHQKSEPSDEIIRLYLRAPRDEIHNNQWWKLRNYFIRELTYKKMYRDAYKIASSHNNLHRADIVDAEWLAGWIALRLMKNPEISKKHFKMVADISTTCISKARGSYWHARSYDESGDQETARILYQKAANHGHTYYGMLASHELGYQTLQLPVTPSITDQDKHNLQKNEYAQIAEFFSYTQNKDKLKKYAKEAFIKAKSTGEIALLYKRLRKNLDLHWKVEISKIASWYGYWHMQDSFPAPYQIPLNGINEAYVYATIRQESNFDTKGLNETGREDGLMQIIPATEKKLCKELGIRYKPKRITEPGYNIKLGTYYLSKEFAKTASYIKTSCEYNAGPVSNSWSERFGDPSSIDLKGVIDWIELIPFHVTRTYVQRVIENMQIYRYVIQKSNKLVIAQDLTCGTSQNTVSAFD